MPGSPPSPGPYDHCKLTMRDQDRRTALRLLQLWLLCCLASSEAQKTVVMNVLYEKSTDFTKAVTFSERKFTDFHRCLCKTTTAQCTAKLGSSPNNRPPVTGTEVTLFSPDEGYSLAFYKCEVLESGLELKCAKQPVLNGTCYDTVSYEIRGMPCESTCVGLMWTNGRIENISSTISNFLYFDQCRDHCSEAVSATPSFTESTSGTTISADGGDSSEPLDDDIAAIALGAQAIVLVIIAVVVVCILWRRGKLNCSCIRSCKHRNSLSDSSTEDNMHGMETSRPYHNPTEGQHSSSGYYSTQQFLPFQGKYYNSLETPWSDNTSGSTLSPDKNNSINNFCEVDYGYSAVHSLESDKDPKGKRLAAVSDRGNNKCEDDNQRTSDNFVYAMAKDTAESGVDERSAARGEDTAEKLDTRVQITTNSDLPYSLQQKYLKGEETAKIDLPSVADIKESGEYGYAIPEDGERWAKSGMATVVQTSGGISGGGDQDYSQIEGDYYPEDCRGVNNGKTRSDNNGVEEGHDEKENVYEYAENKTSFSATDKPAQNDTWAERSHIETAHTTPEDDYSSAEYDNSDYSVSTDTGSKNVYSKLGEKVRDIKNPYNVLLNPKEDPKTRKPLPNPASNPEPTNHGSRYSFAQPISDNSTNPIEVIDVDPRSCKKNATSSDQTQDMGFLKSDSSADLSIAIGAQKETSQDIVNTYFELENKGDDGNSSTSSSELSIS